MPYQIQRQIATESHVELWLERSTHINITIKYKISNRFDHLVFETPVYSLQNQVHLFPTIDMCPYFDYNI